MIPQAVIKAERPVVAVGEALLEIAPDRGAWRLGHGGDTLNTAVYLRRLGIPTAYLTALGADPYSCEMRNAWRGEGLDVSMVLTDARRLPGLYAIRTDALGERRFHYWRSNSAARRLFCLPGIEAAAEAVTRAPLLYLSGITLSLFRRRSFARMLALVASVRAAGGAVAFDPNFRPSLWANALAARSALEAIAPHLAAVLATDADESALYGDGPEQAIRRWRELGVDEVVIKMGADGCLAAIGDVEARIPACEVSRVIDTTGAGDSFNAGYLAARLRGGSAEEAALQAHALAARVIQHPGAIVPRDAGKRGS